MSKIRELSESLSRARYETTLAQNGIAEVTTSYTDGRRLIGKQDERGNLIVLANIKSAPSLWLLYGAVLAGFVVLVLAKFYMQHPLSWASGWLGDKMVTSIIGNKPASFANEFELFSTVRWVTLLLLYALVCGALVAMRAMHRAIPGADIFFAKFGKLHGKLSPSDDKPMLVFDPRVKPHAIVSTATVVFDPQVVRETKDGKTRTKDNIPMECAGKLVGSVADSRLVLIMGGFGKMLERMNATYVAACANEMLRTISREFQFFMLDPVRVDQSGETLTSRLDQISSRVLDPDMLEQIAEINEIDVSQLDVREPDAPKRNGILSAFNWTRGEYGIEITDHIPFYMAIPGENVEIYLFELSSTLQRLRQATDQLRVTRVQENEAEIEAMTREQQFAVIEIHRLIEQMKSIITTLRDDDMRSAIISSKEEALENICKSVVTEKLMGIEATIAQLKALGVQGAALETFLAETDAVYADLEKHIKDYFPGFGTVLTEGSNLANVLPTASSLNAPLELTGTQEVLDALSKSAPTTISAEDFDKQIDDIVGAEGREGVSQATTSLLQEISSRMAEITVDPGVSVADLTRENVEKRLAEITQRFQVSRTATETQTAVAGQE